MKCNPFRVSTLSSMVQNFGLPLRLKDKKANYLTLIILLHQRGAQLQAPLFSLDTKYKDKFTTS